jgi:hypothetical protein
LTTALVYLSPVALLVALGAIAGWLRSARLMLAMWTLAFAALVPHVALAFSLPNPVLAGRPVDQRLPPLLSSRRLGGCSRRSSGATPSPTG